MKKLIVFFLTLNSSLGFAQTEKNFKPLPILDTIPTSNYQELKLRLQLDQQKVTAKGKAGSFMKELYKQRFDYIVKTYNEDYIMVDDDVAGYLQKVLDEIYNANPQLPRDAKIFGYRSDAPNALSFGEGTMCVMLGLLARVETEDVLAYVLCHELAHYHAQHTDRRMEMLAHLNYDKVLKKQISEIQNNPYEKYSKLKALFNSLDLSINKHSRADEFAADSIGLTYYRRTNYNPLAPLRCMQILKEADRGVFKNNIDFKKYFSFSEFPFKDSWIAYKKSDVWHADKTWTTPDSARTHPNCDNRLEALVHQINTEIPADSNFKKGVIIKDITDKAAFELVNTHYHFKQYGKALFQSLVLAEQYPQNVYAHAMIVKCMYQLYRAQKNHVLGKSLELPDPRFEENYDRFLNFIHALRLFELANLSYYYAISQPESFYSDEEFIHALWMASKFDFSKVDSQKVRDDYEQLFPNGKYLQEMNRN